MCYEGYIHTCNATRFLRPNSSNASTVDSKESGQAEPRCSLHSRSRVFCGVGVRARAAAIRPKQRHEATKNNIE